MIGEGERIVCCLAIRAELPLSLDLPSLVWRKLTGQSANLEDLEAIDTQECRSLQWCRMQAR